MKLPAGMTVTPMGFPMMVGAFFGCVSFATGQPEIIEAFERETGYKLKLLVNRTSLEVMIDQSTGHEAQVVAAWLDWVAVNIFGTDKDTGTAT